MAAAQPLPQLTVKAIFLGLVLSMVLAGANAYLGLFAGMTVSASIPAAVISMAVLKLFKNSNILENNIVQTAASAGESIAAGVIFTIPALIILGYWNVFDYMWVTVIAGLGGLLGVLFTIPLRRSLIVEEQLAYPEGTATAEVLKVGAAPGQGAKILGLAGVLGAATKLVETGFRLWAGTAQAATYVGSSTIAYIGMNLSPALVSVGYIVGLNIAVLVFLGGAISWYVAIPIYSTWLLDGDPGLAAQFTGGMAAGDLAYAIWTSQIRYLGVGAMLVGGVWALISMRGSLVSGVVSGLKTKVRNAGAAYDHTQHDTPMRLVFIGIAVFIVPIFVVYQTIVANVGIAFAMTIVMVIAGFLFSSVAAYMAGLVGSSNNPISGITIATILFTSLLLFWLMGAEALNGPAAAIMVGAVVCCAAAIAGDNLQDLKAGYIVGATPWKQQLMQGIGVLSAVLVMAPILNLLLQAYGIGVPTPEQPDALLAPQATLMASVAEGVFGAGLPWNMIAAGAGVGAVIVALDEYLKLSGAAWRAPVLAVAVGIYLPLELSTAILLGGLIAYAASRRTEAGAGDSALAKRNGLLFASGLITGEALIGIAMAVPIVLTGNPNVIAIDAGVPSFVGLLVIAGLAGWLYRVGTKST
ncbi:MAG: oligopeptide transporter, OPT family [Gammaproteobacteria bacterium]|nr:oligopeptide transporter, OPT family [Gammaproteobacteria bacterium]MDH3505499.1 oligopeptide transporter, OPT family [Gammaproteobacteria bacterium]